MTHPKKPKHHKRKEHHVSLSISNKRKAVVIDYLEEDGTNPLQGDHVNGTAKNVDTSDVGSRLEHNNDGEFLFFYPADFTGSDEVTLTGSDGGSITGTITI